MEYELTDKDFKEIYEQAVREFNYNSVQHKQTYSNFLTRCMLKALLGFLHSKKIEVREGKMYVTKEDN